jgi:hypothetical protein
VAARRLPSGDVLITFDGEDSKRRWAKDPTIKEAFGSNACIQAREYTVMAHGLRVATVDMRDQKKAIEGIYRQNPNLREMVEIVRVGWARRAIQQGK